MRVGPPGDAKAPAGMSVPTVPPLPSGPPPLAVAPQPAAPDRATAVGGRIFTPAFAVLLALVAAAWAVMLWRFVSGLGATTALNDGYPWGLWIAFDDVTGTALAAGGYGVALLVYALNRGRYHPLVRPAIVVSALGYTLAGLSVILDLGRYWNVWKVPLYVGEWNLNSALLSVSLCLMGYLVALWIQASTPLMERWQTSKSALLRRVARVGQPIVRAILPFVLAAGLLLATLQQASLGTVFVGSTKVHPVWQSALLPLLFLLSAMAMGYAGVAMEATLSSRAFRRRNDWALLEGIARVAAWIVMVFVGLRFVDLIARNQLLRAISFDAYSILFILEIALFLVPAFLLLDERWRANHGVLFASAMMLILGGALYRFDVYVVAFDPGPEWRYFPSVPEIVTTVGLVATELAAYVFLVRRFPILRGAAAAPSSEVRT